MLGGKRMIWIKKDGGKKKMEEEVKRIEDEKKKEKLIMIEEGDIKKGEGLRREVEND